VKHADNIVSLRNEEAVLQGMTDRVTEIGMEMNVEKTEVMRI
jgi:hypothetical protein